MARKVRVGGFWSGLFGGENKTITYKKDFWGRDVKVTKNHNTGRKSTTRSRNGFFGGRVVTGTCNRCDGKGTYQSPNYKGKKPPQPCKKCGGTGTFTKTYY